MLQFMGPPHIVIDASAGVNAALVSVDRMDWASDVFSTMQIVLCATMQFLRA